MATHSKKATGNRPGVRLNARQADSVRSHIQTSQLLRRLNDHALNPAEFKTTPQGTLRMIKGMDATQIKAAEILLRKSLPDLSSVEMVADVAVTAPRGPAELEALAKYMQVPLDVLYGAKRKG